MLKCVYKNLLRGLGEGRSTIEVYDEIKKGAENEPMKDFEVIENDDGLFLVSRKLNKDNSRKVLSLTFAGDSEDKIILKHGDVRHILDLDAKKAKGLLHCFDPALVDKIYNADTDRTELYQELGYYVDFMNSPYEIKEYMEFKFGKFDII